MLFVQSDAARSRRNHWPFWPEDSPAAKVLEPETGHLAQRSVVLGSDECIDIQIIGVDGRPLYEDHRCNPDRCVVSGRAGASSCGDPPISGLDAQRIPTDSCDNPPVIAFADHGAVYPQPEDMADGGSPADAGSQRASERDAADAMPPNDIAARPHAGENLRISSGGCSVPHPRSTSGFRLEVVLLAAWWSFMRRRRPRRV